MRLLYWIPAFCLAVAIFVLSSIPDFGALEKSFLTKHDKITHLIVYGLLAWWVLWGWVKGLRETPGTLRFILTALVTAAYGVSDEFHQAFIPGRLASVDDWLADVIGGLLGSIVFATMALAIRRPLPPGGRKSPRGSEA